MLIIWKFSKSIAGHTKCPRGPHVACGTRVGDPRFVKSWMSSHFSENRDLSFSGMATWPESHRKESCWLHPRGRKFEQGTGEVNTSLTWQPEVAENFEVFWNMLYSPDEENWVWKWMNALERRLNLYNFKCDSNNAGG